MQTSECCSVGCINQWLKTEICSYLSLDATCAWPHPECHDSTSHHFLSPRSHNPIDTSPHPSKAVLLFEVTVPLVVGLFIDWFESWLPGHLLGIHGASALGLMLSPSNRVASVQSEPGQQNLLLQQPLGRKRGLRQVRTWGVNKPFLRELVWFSVSGLKWFVDVTCPFQLICDTLFESAGTAARVVAVTNSKRGGALCLEFHNLFLCKLVYYYFPKRNDGHTICIALHSVFETEKAQTPQVHRKEMSEPWTP